VFSVANRNDPLNQVLLVLLGVFSLTLLFAVLVLKTPNWGTTVSAGIVQPTNEVSDHEKPTEAPADDPGRFQELV
jgi:hypothetical protein